MKLQTLLWCFVLLMSSVVLQGEAQLFGNFKPTPWFQGSGSVGIWRCGDWRSKFRIIECNNPNNPVIDFPPGYDIGKLLNMPRRWNYIPGIGRFRFGGGTPLVKIFGVPVYGYPDVYRDSDYDD